ncbi:hypothetical protein [Bradyrhizobium sp. Ash2021]|uniref:hypothetical protein n=1 Tax=Bradyrhizobium sp. Ash2021 TaxID=2954771 RepID=UPI002814CFD4|nr:hypothetical protein [Bradyrhizobium sp. Ash2021]WMT73427.1 hypothetical protein NL528_36595 [Bradyrhizobium sp. Ash2021]
MSVPRLWTTNSQELDPFRPRHITDAMKFVQDRPFANPEAAARKLLALVLQQDIDVGQFTNIGTMNRAFLDTGGSELEYVAGCACAIESQWFKIDPSGFRIILLDAGAEQA